MYDGQTVALQGNFFAKRTTHAKNKEPHSITNKDTSQQRTIRNTMTMLTESLTSAWSAYNAPVAIAPFSIPLILWTTAYAYARYSQFSFHKWETLHNLHNLGAIALGIMSLYYQDDTRFNERIGILWSVGYFLIDIIDCSLRSDGPYLLHGILCLGLGLANYTHPVCRHLRTNSKAALCELSNPFMHWAKRTRQPLQFLLFVLVYTMCRIVWIPIMIQECRNEGMEWQHPIVLAVMGFYALNWYWYIKMGKILVEGLFRSAKKGKQAKHGDSKKTN
ncbi:hypothetical protein FisN_7Hh395 [Fistulifera solaris]|uniref:TLC domain-containing protein n=1 Tax=Fistulifera solaris TaxID=1519565 RepID=A0A1Z5KRR2_FISSO|nr:hypothetical protein FisN_7Hh395 [Fistulifera solaris]|eukprot:GAX29014.1 hypothetical protein FisN_7Hh395 [Fistulifera solaris]